MAFVLAGVAEAALTEQQVNAALGSVPGVSWSISGPNADAWTVGPEPDLRVTSAVAGASYTLKATVTGPGVLKLLTFRNSPDLVAELNGVPRPEGYDTARIYLGEGMQTVTWKVTHVAGNDNPATMMFRTATWEPFNLLPLSVGEADGSVKLSGSWVGQDGFHHGDGGAAYFGDPGVSSGVLRGDFTGPGVMIYEFNQRAGAPHIFALDGVESQGAAGISQPFNTWHRRWHPVEEGGHVATWTLPVDDGKYSVEMAVDEVRVVPEVDLETAMDTPGRVWTSTASGMWRAFGVPMADAPGGNSVLLNSRVTLSSVFTSHGWLKVRSRLGATEISINGTVVSPTMVGNSGGWGYRMIAVPAGGGTVTIDGEKDLEIGGVEWFPLLEGLAEALGLPGGTEVTPSWKWEIFGNASGDGHVVKAMLDGSYSEASMDVSVTGPARVTIGYEANGNGRLAFLLDGEDLWDSRVPAGNEVTLEVPRGEHVLRLLARRDGGADPLSFQPEIKRMTVAPDDDNEYDNISHELGFDAKWAYAGAWEVVVGPSFDADGALKPVVPAGATGEVAVWLGTTVTGPGYFSFRRCHLAEGISVTLHGDMIPDPEPEEPAAYGEWKESRVWIPEGAHKVQVKVAGPAEAVADFRLDEMNFEPLGMALGSIASGPPQVWQNDPVNPWLVLKAPEGMAYAISPLRQDWDSEGTSRISTTVEGPGVLHFIWRTHGQRNMVSELWVNGVKVSNQPTGAFDYLGRQRIEIMEEGPAVVEWVATPGDIASWMELSEVEWMPWAESSLASALDAPEGVTWESGGDAVFTGRPDRNAVNGTAAHVSLEPGQATWLEATVEGPGVFDFKMPEPSGVTGSGWPRLASWTLTVDGVGVGWYTQQGRNPIWIREGGTHKIRLNFNATGYSPISGLVDAVTWVPLVTRTMDGSWASEMSETLNGYEGPDGGGIILRTAVSEPSWIEKTVTGPCEVTWKSQIVQYGDLANGQPTVTVDGKAPVRIHQARNWDRNTLTIPAGTHVIRWSNGPGDGYGWVLPMEMQGSYWQISDPVVTPGVSPIAEAIDAPDSCWLVLGEEGQVKTGAGAMGDRYEDGAFYYMNLSDSLQRVSGDTRSISDPYWRRVYWNVDPGKSQPWSGFTFAPYFFAFYGTDLDAVVVKSLPQMEFDEAVDRPGEVFGMGWNGVASATESADGVDCGWSFLDDPAQSNVAVMVVNGAGTLKFRWKTSGTAVFHLRLNGALLTTEAEGWWKDGKIELGNGLHRIEWVHGGMQQGQSSGDVSEAWLDEVSFEAGEPWGLTEAAIGSAPGVQLSVDESVESLQQWKAVRANLGYQQMKSAARVVTGASVMRATVTGPKVMSFSGWCFGDEVIPTLYYYNIVDEWLAPRFTTETTWPVGHEITVRMDGNIVGSISHRREVYWDYASFMVPEGTHEITWQLNRVLNTGARQPSTRTDVQGWIADIRVQSRKDAFANWMPWQIEHLRGANDDADGDGVNNLLEYAWNSRPDDSYSKPQQVIGRRNAAGNSYEVMVPYLNPLVIGKLQSSDDMVTWQDHPVQWLESKPATGAHTVTHQSVTIPVSPEDKARFFRVRVEVPE